MAKHTLKDILQIFAKHAGHTHEAAVQATYDAGHAQGVADTLEKVKAATPDPAPAPAPQTEGDASDENKETETAKAGKDTETQQDAAGP
jgi:hypothetical protein